MVYRLWLHCVRRHETVTLEQMKEMAPYMAEKLALWDKYVDRNGATTQNMEEYMAFRKEMAEKAKA
jgi:hypothetical protein